VTGRTYLVAAPPPSAVIDSAARCLQGRCTRRND
jgi:hypothetical protein